jgi:heparosan-N-sulfate-glucuronate 5-epimerase
MKYLKNTKELIIDTYLLYAKHKHKPSLAYFWYLTESANIKNIIDLENYKYGQKSPTYLLDYRSKLAYPLINSSGIIVLPYHPPLGMQVNPEAAFQYALGLHDRFIETNHSRDLEQFYHYVNYFLTTQNTNGLFEYQFNWLQIRAPWSSALAQGHGASMMLRAFKLTNDERYLLSAKKALKSFSISTEKGGFLHYFSPGNCYYFEEYPKMPTGVLNGFMSSLISIWELQYWTKENWIIDLWYMGVESLEKMLPFYTNGWWSLYDLDKNSPIKNVNTLRYHLLEIDYLQILSILTHSLKLTSYLEERKEQSLSMSKKISALVLKVIRKILYL